MYQSNIQYDTKTHEADIDKCLEFKKTNKKKKTHQMAKHICACKVCVICVEKMQCYSYKCI